METKRRSRRPRIERTCQHCGKVFGALRCRVDLGRGLYCSKRCAGAARRTPPEERFWRHVARGDGCWLWTGCKLPSGHGQFQIGHDRSKPVLAHRFSWEMHRGPIPNGTNVCHNCPGGDNPACVNPAHSFLGDQGANMADAKAKGRTRNGAREHPERIPRGEVHHAAKLSEADVRAIREAVAAGARKTDMARRYGVSPWTIRQVVAGRAWRHMTPS